MKRELAFALEAQSQFPCFVGRTRSAKDQQIQCSSSSKKRKKKRELESTDQLENSINGVSGFRRSKRLKTGVLLDEDSLNVDKPKAGVELVLVEAAKGEEGARGLDGELNVQSEKRKTEVKSDVPRRFTRSALKEKEEENVEKLGTTLRKKLELKMSKKIGLNKMPTNMRELLETGLLEGFKVFYNFGDKGMNLQGVINGIGILCSCSLCEGSKVISPSQFELHACKSYRHAIKHICLENGTSLLQVMEVCKASALETLEVAIQTVINSLPVEETSICINSKGLFEPSSIVDEGLFCDSCINSEQRQAGERDGTNEKSRKSKKVSVPKSSASAKLTISPEKSHQETKRNSVVRTSPRSLTKCHLLEEKSEQKMAMKSKRSAPKSPKSASGCNLSANKAKGKISKRPLRSRSVSTPTKSAAPPASTSLQKSITKKDQQLHWSVFKEGGLPDGTELTYLWGGKVRLTGYKRGSGIVCFCCNQEVSPSQFEAHAGYASRKKPYGNIYVSSGVSLHDFAVSLNKNSVVPVRANDDLCGICEDGGELLLCDGCPRSFHQVCVAEPTIPPGKWYCKYCQNSMKCVEQSANALAAGRVAGVDPIEQITKRCIRIIKTPETTEVVSCVLCRCYDFTDGEHFDDRTVIVCDQCEKEYHIGCLREQKLADLKELPKGKWFCCRECARINSVLENLLTCGPKKLPDALMGVTREKTKDSGFDATTNFDMRWSILSGHKISPESKLLLEEAVHIFREGFDPIIDANTNSDFIPAMVYGGEISEHDFGRMYCAVLTVNSSVVTAGVIRVFGQDVAELPIVATSKSNQRKGYFRAFFTCFEKLLSYLNVKKIVLPAAEEAISMWFKLGFKKLSSEELIEYRQILAPMLTFKGTSMLGKAVPKGRSKVAETGVSDLSV